VDPIGLDPPPPIYQLKKINGICLKQWFLVGGKSRGGYEDKLICNIKFR
jgi:hypothetical protein